MTKARNGSLSKNFGDKDNKIKARFSDEGQALRVSILMQYVHVAVKQGAQGDDIEDMLKQDAAKCFDILTKIKKRHIAAGGIADLNKDEVNTVGKL